MNLTVKYDELSKFVKDRYSKDLEFQYVTNDTVKVTLRVKVLIAMIPVSIKLTVKSVDADNIVLTYDGKGIDLIINGILKLLEGKLDQFGNVVTFNPGQEIVVHYSSIEKIAKALEYLSLQDISFDSEGVLISATLH